MSLKPQSEIVIVDSDDLTTGLHGITRKSIITGGNGGEYFTIYHYETILEKVLIKLRKIFLKIISLCH